MFDEVHTNNGGDYDGTTGIFTVPYNGTYEFIAIIKNDLDNEIFAHLSIKDKLYTRMQVRAAWYTTGVATMVTHLVQGDEVSVRPMNDAEAFHHNYNQFSGHIISIDC